MSIRAIFFVFNLDLIIFFAYKVYAHCLYVLFVMYNYFMSIIFNNFAKLHSIKKIYNTHKSTYNLNINCNYKVSKRTKHIIHAGFSNLSLLKVTQKILIIAICTRVININKYAN